VPEEKIEKLKDRGEKVIEATEKEKNLKHKQLLNFIGLANFVCCSRIDRAGAELLRNTYSWMEETEFYKKITNRDERRILIRSVKAIIEAMKRAAPIILSEERAGRPIIHLFTDASSNGKDNKPVAAAVLLDEKGNIYQTSTQELPAGERIEFYEAAALLLGVVTFKDLMKDRHLFSYIDNVVDVFHFIKANSKNANTSRVITETILIMRELGISVYFDFVKSELNIADWPTREEKLKEIEEIIKPIVIEPAEIEYNKIFGGKIGQYCDKILDSEIRERKLIKEARDATMKTDANLQEESLIDTEDPDIEQMMKEILGENQETEESPPST
jgi:hypothetical protein